MKSSSPSTSLSPSVRLLSHAHLSSTCAGAARVPDDSRAHGGRSPCVARAWSLPQLRSPWAQPLQLAAPLGSVVEPLAGVRSSDGCSSQHQRASVAASSAHRAPSQLPVSPVVAPPSPVAAFAVTGRSFRHCWSQLLPVHGGRSQHHRRQFKLSPSLVEAFAISSSSFLPRRSQLFLLRSGRPQHPSSPVEAFSVAGCRFRHRRSQLLPVRGGRPQLPLSPVAAFAIAGRSFRRRRLQQWPPPFTAPPVRRGSVLQRYAL